MSETTGPAPPAAPAADTSSSDFAPAPDTRPELSVSDAARMLRNARRAQPAPQQGLPNVEQPAGFGHNSGEAAPQPPQTPAQPGGMSALERALGLQPDSDNP